MTKNETNTVLIIGVSSPIAYELAKLYADAKYNLIITARNLDELERHRNDLSIHYKVNVRGTVLDLNNRKNTVEFCQELLRTNTLLKGLVYAAGYMPTTETDNAAQRAQQEQTCFNVNFSSAAYLCSQLAVLLNSANNAFIIGISSVAGDRGRQSNYAYGAAKGGFSLYLQGLRNQLHSRKINVLTVKPGFIDTNMTWGLSGLFLVAPPKSAAKAIFKANKHKRNIIYFPWFWRWIMFIIKMIPETIFKRLKL